jgi:TRAP-type mannitol/chloroaromatic compound transport system substrate-binding protein
MKTRQFIVMLMGVIFGILVFSSDFLAAQPKPTPAGKTYKWQMQHALAPNTPAANGFVKAMEHLKEITNGRFIITVHSTGTLMADADLLDGASRNTVQIVSAPDAFFSGKDPGFAPLFTIPGLQTNLPETMLWFYHFGGLEIAKEAYAKYGVHASVRCPSPAEPLMSKKPVRTLDDLKGMKIRSVPGLIGDLFTSLGARVIRMGFGDIYSALSTGVLDGAELIAISDNYKMGIHEVTKSFLWPSFHTQFATVPTLINKKTWDELPRDLQLALEAVLDRTAQEYYYPAMAEDYTYKAKMIAHGLEWTQLSAKDNEKIQEIAIQVADEYRKKSPLADKVISSYKDYMKSIGKIK